MTTLIIRPFQGEADLPRIVDLINACEAVDHFEDGTSLAELRLAFAHPDFDTTRDIRLWEDADGLAVYAEAHVYPNADSVVHLWFKVRPDAREAGLEDQVIEWAQERVCEVATEYGRPFRLNSTTPSQASERIALFERHGFRPVRYFLRLLHELDGELPVLPLPPNYSLRQFQGESDVERWVEMFNQSFIDHWNFQPLTAEQLRYYNSDPQYRADLDLIAVAPDGTFAGFCYSTYSQEVNARSGRNEGFIAVLGTRRGHRKLGLGRVLLLEGMRRLQQAGATCAALYVDAENPSGATRLYESVGFRPMRTNIVYTKDREA